MKISVLIKRWGEKLGISIVEPLIMFANFIDTVVISYDLTNKELPKL